VTDVLVAAWNLHQAMDRRSANIDATWRYLEAEVAPTVALVQEAHRMQRPTLRRSEVLGRMACGPLDHSPRAAGAPSRSSPRA
jgi:hypothetical protein